MSLHQTNKTHSARVRQGDIFQNVPYYESYKEINGEFALTVFEFPYVVVLTQDCDLEQNKNSRNRITDTSGIIENDKHLVSVIVAPLYNKEHFLIGEHLSDIGITSQKFNSSLKKPVLSNQNSRYHYIELGSSVVVPDSVIDFKHYFTISLNWLEGNLEQRICGIEPIYRELISQRFSNYLSRIGLPEPDDSATAEP